MNGSITRLTPLYVSIADKIIGALGFAGILISIILLSVFKSRVEDVFLFGASVCILFLICSVNALFPKVLWELEMLRLSAFINEAEDATPTALYFIIRKALTYCCLIFGTVLLILTLIFL